MKIQFNTLLILLFTLPWFMNGCSNQTSRQDVGAGSAAVPSQSSNAAAFEMSKEELEKIYTIAIGDYIRAAKKDYHLDFDTLVFGKHVYGQPDDFPDINLPATIAGTHIRLVTPEAGQSMVQADKSLVYINLMGWVTPENAEFLFVTFSNGFAHQFDCSISYDFNAQSKAFELDSLSFKNYQYKE